MNVEKQCKKRSAWFLKLFIKEKVLNINSSGKCKILPWKVVDSFAGE